MICIRSLYTTCMMYICSAPHAHVIQLLLLPVGHVREALRRGAADAEAPHLDVQARPVEEALSRDLRHLLILFL